MANKVCDLRRKRFGRLTAIKRVYENKQSYWFCICDCGNETKVSRKHLLDGCTKSCGCLAAEVTKKRCWKGCGEISGTYWHDISRNAKFRAIPFAIAIEEAWQLYLKQNKKCALTGEMLNFYTKRKKDIKSQTASLDRIDNTKPYTCSNCCWVHKRINKLKNDFSIEELLYWTKKIVEHNEQNKQITTT